MIVGQKEFIRKSARYFRDKPAFIFKGGKPALIEGRSLTFGEVDRRANRLANALSGLGCPPGTRVATLAHNCLEYAEIEFGLMKGAFPQTILNPMLSAPELLYQINNSESAVLVLQQRYAEMIGSMRGELRKVKHFICFDGTGAGMADYEALLASADEKEPEVELDPKALGELRYTGGTTGTPKGIMLPFQSAAAVTRDLIMEYLGDLTYEDKWLAVQPLFHGAGWYILPVWVKGLTQYIVNDFHAEAALEIIEKERITAVKTIPTVLMRMLDHPDIRKRDLSSVRTIIYGGEPMPVARLKEAMDIFGDVFIQLYGQTEAPMLISVLKKEDHKREKLLKSVGRPCTMVKVRVVDEKNREVGPGEIGEIIVRGDHMMTGYMNNPEATAEALVDGWLHTKDLGTVDDEGYLYLSGGRTSDMIISGGENIYPQEIEHVLYQHHAVSESCAFGVPDERWGEAVTAAVALKPGQQATEAELIEFCRTRLAGYKKPQKIHFLAELPKSGAGKIVRKQLREQFKEGGKA
ncbi:MAG: AMP-binding protein [Chloroflexota bacterium]